METATAHGGDIGEWRRVNILTIAVTTRRTGAQALVPIMFAFYGIASEDGDAGLAAILFGLGGLLVVALMVGSAWLSWYRLRYRVGANDVRLEQGIISRSARSIPYDRIQDVSLEQKLFPRLLGLVEVKFETGAGGKDELKLSYVSEAEGEKLRESVRAMVEEEPRLAPQAVTAHGAQAEAPHAQARAQTLFTMGPKRLFVFGLFNFSLVVFAVLLGALQQLEFLLPLDLWDYFEDLVQEERIAEAGALVNGYSRAAQIAAIVYAVVAVIAVGMASGVVRTFVRDWEFRLERTAKGFRRRRGLLTKTDVVMPVHRVQALVLKTGIIRRLFGWYGLSFISLAQDAGKANHDVAPFARMEEIAPVADEAGFSLPDGAEDWRRPSPNYYFDRAVITGLLVTIVGIVVFTAAAAQAGELVPGLLIIAGAASIAVAFVAAREYYLWHYDRHALDPVQVLSRRGWLAPRTQIANRVKLHSVEIAQGPLARWRGYCNLVFGLAGGTFAFRGLSVEDARMLRAAVLDSIADVDFAKLPR